MSWAQLRRCAISALLMALLSVAFQEDASAQESPPVFAETPCDLPAVSAQNAPRMRCGTVSVPRDYDNPRAGRFKLALVVIKSAEQPAESDPVVYISGGPGRPLTVYADYQASHPYAPRRDLILIDQRGTGRSEPKLCPDLNDKLIDANLAVIESITDETLTRLREVYAACRDEAIARGFDLQDFGTRVTVQDFESVREALAVERWNVFGESYGTTVAMTLAELHPEHIRTLVLDSLYPPDPIPPRSVLAKSALEAFFVTCAQDQTCSTSFPDLAATYRETVERLQHTPLTVALPPGTRGADLSAQLTGSSFEVLVYSLLYYPPNYPGIPRLIAAVHDGQTQGLGLVIASIIKEIRQGDLALSAAVECRDRPQLRALPASNADAYDRRELNSICDEWSALGPAPLIPAGTQVPTLVLGGQFDPVAGPSLSRRIVVQLGDKARLVEFPVIGHNVRAFSVCGAKVASEFIDRPGESLDTSCVDRPPAIKFLH